MRPGLKRSVAAGIYLIDGLRTAVPSLIGLYFSPLLLLFGFVGFPLLPKVLRPVRAVADIERRRAGRALGRPIPSPYPQLSGGPTQQAAQVLQSSSTWRDLAWMVLNGITGPVIIVFGVLMWPSVLYSLALPFWWWAAPKGVASAFVPLDSWPKALTLPFLQAALEIAILWWAVPALVRFQQWLAESLLGPSRASLTERAERLTETRAEALEAHGAELRRIERDLHDGAQAQLVSVAMRLGLADRRFADDPEAARKLLLEARDGVEEALAQLRTIVRGIYPPILSDRGLADSVRALAAAQHIPITVDIPDDQARAPAAVEAGAYFVVAEGLTNIAKHSGAANAHVSVRRDGPSLRIMVRDDGRGGADPASGTGLAGIRRRVAALDGVTRFESAVGEGTTLEVELPCES